MADTFTPEQIAQILEEFFKVVGTRQYIGARYVPIFGRKGEESIEWDNSAPYEPLTIVLYQGNSYTSRQFVPVGVAITNQEFWAITGNFNAQVEMYRRETAAAREIAEAAQNDIDTLLPKADFNAENTVKKYVDDSVAIVQNDIDTLLPKANFSAENTVKKYIDENPTRILTFDTVADMQAATMLKSGMVCHTNGFHASDDGGAAWYVITDNNEANGMDILECGNVFANLIIEGSTITPEMLGANADGFANDTEFIARCIELCNHVILRKSYGLTGIELKDNLVLEGKENTTIRMLETHLCLYATNDKKIENVVIKGVNFVGTGSYEGTSTGESLTKDVAISIRNEDSENITISDCTFTDFGDVGIRVSGNNSIIENNKVLSNIDYSEGGSLPNYSFGIDVDGDNLRIENNAIDGYIQGIITGLNFSNSIIAGNNIKQKHQHGMYIEGGQNIVISNNIVTGYANSICGIKIQNNSTTNVMDTFIVNDNIIRAGDVGQAIFVVGLTDCSVSNVKISNNMLWGARGVELSNVFDCDINNNIIEIYNVAGSYGIRIGSILDKENGKSDIHIIGNTIKGHACIHIAPPATQNTEYRFTVCDNTVLFYDNELMTSVPFAITTTRVSNFICSGNTIKGISVGAGRSGLYMEPNTIEKLGVIGNYINGFASDIRIGSTITADQRAKINYNLYDTAIGL